LRDGFGGLAVPATGLVRVPAIPPAPPGIFTACSPSCASTSTPSTSAGSTTAPAGAARCATTATASARRGQAERLAGRTQHQPSTNRRNIVEGFFVLCVAAWFIGYWIYRAGKQTGSRVVWAGESHPGLNPKPDVHVSMHPAFRKFLDFNAHRSSPGDRSDTRSVYCQRCWPVQHLQSCLRAGYDQPPRSRVSRRCRTFGNGNRRGRVPAL